MSIAALAWAFALPVKQPLKGVLVALANHADKAGRAWPSCAVIATEAGIDVRTVISATKRLEDLGLIEVEHSSGRVANRYSIRVGEQGQVAAGNSDPGARLDGASTVTGDHRNSDPGALFNGDPGTPLNRAKRASNHDPGVSNHDPGAFNHDPGSPKPIRTKSNPHWGTRTTNSRPPKISRRPTSVPEPFVVTKDMIRWAGTLGVPRRDIRSETDQFLDRHRARGTQFKDWVAAWRTWMRNAVKFRAECQATPPKDDGPWKPGVYSE